MWAGVLYCKSRFSNELTEWEGMSCGVSGMTVNGYVTERNENIE